MPPKSSLAVQIEAIEQVDVGGVLKPRGQAVLVFFLGDGRLGRQPEPLPQDLGMLQTTE